MNLKTKEEVEEYLKNLFIEYRFGCEYEKNPQVCHLLGDYHESIKDDNEAAMKLYKMNCDKYNFGLSCTKYGDFKLAGKGCTKDSAEAYKYLKKGCTLNNAKACYHAGIVAVTEAEVLLEKDRSSQISSGVKFLKQACHENNFEPACFFLSGVYIKGVEGHFEKNLEEGYKLSLKCCEKENPYACANVSQMHQRGEGVPKNPELANVFKKRAQSIYDDLNKKTRLEFSNPL